MERHVAPTPLPRFIRIDAPAILMLRDNPSIRTKTDLYPDASSSNHGATCRAVAQDHDGVGRVRPT